MISDNSLSRVAKVSLINQASGSHMADHRYFPIHKAKLLGQEYELLGGQATRLPGISWAESSPPIQDPTGPASGQRLTPGDHSP